MLKLLDNNLYFNFYIKSYLVIVGYIGWLTNNDYLSRL